jgi:hypothetical protein
MIQATGNDVTVEAEKPLQQLFFGMMNDSHYEKSDASQENS